MEDTSNSRMELICIISFTEAHLPPKNTALEGQMNLRNSTQGKSATGRGNWQTWQSLLEENFSPEPIKNYLTGENTVHYLYDITQFQILVPQHQNFRSLTC